MARIDVNLDEAPDSFGELHPEGMLAVRIVSGEVRDTKSGDGKYINWRLDPIESENKKPVWLMTSLKREALWNLKALLKSARVQWSTDGSFDLEDAFGAELLVNVKHEMYQGELRERVGTPYKALT